MASIEEVRAKAQEIDSVLDSTKETAKKSATWAGAGIFLVIIVVFFLGRKRGRFKNTVVEVYRG